MIKNIIFDFGAVLIPINESLCWDEFSKLGSNDKLRDQKEIFHSYEKGELKTEEFVKQLKPFFFRKNIFSKDLSAAWNALLYSALPEENITLLKNLKKNYRLFLLSNTNELHIKYIKQNAGPFTYSQFIKQFEKVYYSYEMGMRKPDKEIYEKVLSENALDPEETFYVEDGAKHIQTAKKLKIKTWHFKPEQDSILDIEKLIAKQ